MFNIGDTVKVIKECRKCPGDGGLMDDECRKAYLNKRGEIKEIQDGDGKSERKYLMSTESEERGCFLEESQFENNNILFKSSRSKEKS